MRLPLWGVTTTDAKLAGGGGGEPGGGEPDPVEGPTTTKTLSLRLVAEATTQTLPATRPTMVPVRVPEPVTVATVVSRLLQLQFRSRALPPTSFGWHEAVAEPPTATATVSGVTKVLAIEARSGAASLGPAGVVDSFEHAMAVPARSAHNGNRARRRKREARPGER
ncbi:MAG: hypothetical protein ACRDU4_00295 [Mycobacterium sp.]